jgi:hypothetical protein
MLGPSAPGMPAAAGEDPTAGLGQQGWALGARHVSAHGAGAVTPRLPAAWPPGSAALLASSPNGAAPWGGAVMPWARGCRPSPDDTTFLLSGRGHRGSVVRGSMASTSTEQASEPRHCRHRHLPDLALLAKSSPPWLPTSAAASRVVLHRYQPNRHCDTQRLCRQEQVLLQQHRQQQYRRLFSSTVGSYAVMESCAATLATALVLTASQSSGRR